MSWIEHAAPRRARPPHVRGAMPRPRLLALLQGAPRVLVGVAPAGYGKTTALAAHLAELGPTCWYALDADDTDPMTLAGGLTLSVARLEGGEALTRAMDAGASPRQVARLAVDVLEERGALLVLDEAQHLTHPLLSEMARELLAAPRVVLLSRTPLALPELTALEARGEARVLGTSEFSFDLPEMRALFEAMGATVTPAEARLAHAVTEGWPIAARFLAQAVAGGQVQIATLRGLEVQATQLATLFAYLAQEVLGPLDPALREFLRRSSLFEALTPALLHDVLREPRAAEYLATLARGGTFLVREDLPGERLAYRAHPLLRAHLRGLLDPDEARDLARRGAEHFERIGVPRLALHARLLSGDPADAARLLAEHGSRWLGQGRVALVERVLEQLPEDAWRDRPELFALLGDVRRAQSRYAEALAAYENAPERLRVLGEAQVYLDTVRPALAEPRLERAEAFGPEGAERLTRLRAENDLNAGRLARAVERLPSIERGARYALRSGRLHEALDLARHGARGEMGGQRAAQNHREALLLESLVCAFLGEVDEALDSARAGLSEGERLESPFVQSLACARLGHAQAAAGAWSDARATYAQALELGRPLDVPRLCTEPLMGLAFLDAAQGRPGARRLLDEALAICAESGDPYMAALLRLTYALGLLHHGDPASPTELRAARQEFVACGDAFGRASADLALFHVGAGDARDAADALSAYPDLLARPALLAPARSRARRAAVLAALARSLPGRRDEWRPVAVALGYTDVPTEHPGHEVRVQLLGRLALHRGDEEIRDWGRAKARELLALLAVHEGGIGREAAQEALYPDADPGVGDRNMRVVLHALGSLLEPQGPPQYFLERGDWLRLRPSPDLLVDWREAWKTLGEVPGRPGRAGRLLTLPERVANIELPDLEAEAERYATRLPEALTEEAVHALRRGDVRLACRLAERALVVEPAYEPATRALMRAHHAQANASGVARAFRACHEALSALGLAPMSETVALLRTLSGETRA